MTEPYSELSSLQQDLGHLNNAVASAISLVPDSLLDLVRPLDLELTLDEDLALLLHLEPDEVELLLLDVVSSLSSNLHK